MDAINKWGLKSLVPLLLGTLAFVTASATLAQGNSGASALSIFVPKVVEMGFITPVNVEITETEPQDPLTRLTIEVPTNPPGHQHALTAQFADNSSIQRVETRVRLAGQDQAVIIVSATLKSGRTLTSSNKVRLEDGVDFEDKSELTKRLRMNIEGLKGPVGTARGMLSRDGQYGRKLRGIIYHPMLPQIKSEPSDYISNVEIRYRDQVLAQMDWGDAISNDPYFALKFKDEAVDLGQAHILWKDTRGEVFEPAHMEVKE